MGKLGGCGAVGRLLRQELSVVVGVVLNEFLAAVMEEVGQGGVAVAGEVDFVVFGPNDDAY